MDRLWMRDALCAQSSPDLWFPEGSLHEVNAEARRICKKCPVIDECLAYAFGNEGFGVWGGMTSLERRSIYEPQKYPAQRRRALEDLGDYGITLQRIKEAYEHSGNDGSMENGFAYYRKNGPISNSRPRE